MSWSRIRRLSAGASLRAKLLALQMMRAIKQALDPQNIMNPGRVLAPQ